MSEHETNTAEQADGNAPLAMDPKQEREALKARAQMLGIQLSGNQSNDTIRALIKAHMDKMDSEANGGTVNATPAVTKSAGTVRTPTLREYLQAEQMKLVRVRITNMDPKKAKIPSEIITVSNEYLGTVRKLVPFGEATENGYHIPVCILNVLKERRFLQITERPGRNGVPIVKSEYVREFAIEELPPLTEQELADLKKAQQASGSVDLKD